MNKIEPNWSLKKVIIISKPLYVTINVRGEVRQAGDAGRQAAVHVGIQDIDICDPNTEATSIWVFTL